MTSSAVGSLWLSVSVFYSEVTFISDERDSFPGSFPVGSFYLLNLLLTRWRRFVTSFWVPVYGRFWLTSRLFMYFSTSLRWYVGSLADVFSSHCGGSRLFLRRVDLGSLWRPPLSVSVRPFVIPSNLVSLCFVWWSYVGSLTGDP